MGGPPQYSLARRVRCLPFLLPLLLLPCGMLRAQSSAGQENPLQAGATPAAPAQTPASSENAEVSSHDTPTTFKVRVNLVLVRVVVRDALGKVVGDLRKEDFQLFDSGKPQVISAFSLETPESHVPPPVTQASAGEPEASPESAAKIAAGLPQRFVAILFDDEHFSMEDSVYVRSSATRLFDALAASDRVGVYTTSGQVSQEFTNNRELISKALLGIIPRASFGDSAGAVFGGVGRGERPCGGRLAYGTHVPALRGSDPAVGQHAGPADYDFCFAGIYTFRLYRRANRSHRPRHARQHRDQRDGRPRTLRAGCTRRHRRSAA